MLSAPQATAVYVCLGQHNPGDCCRMVMRVIKALDGELTIDDYSWRSGMSNVGATKIGNVNGDLVAKNVDGNLNIDQ